MIKKTSLIGKKFSFILVFLSSMPYTQAAVADGNTREDRNMTNEAVSIKEKNEGVKKKSPFNANAVKVLVLSALGVVTLSVVYAWRSEGKGGGGPEVPPVYPKARIKSDGYIKAFADKKLIVRTAFDYKSKDIYEAMGGYKPENVYLTNGANPTLSTGGGGTNQYLTTLINAMVDEKRKGKKDTWGRITKGVSGAWDKKNRLKVGEYAISWHDTRVNIAHILGPVKKNEENLKALKEGITKFLTETQNGPEVIVLAGIGTGIYSRTDQERRMTYQAIIDGLEDFYAKAGDDFVKPILCLNHWDMKHLEGMEDIPKVQKLR